MCVAALRHLKGMAQQTEARHIRAGVHGIAHHAVARGLVQRRHQAVCQRHGLRRGQPGLCGRREHTDAEGLRQQQHVAGAGSGVGQQLFRMHEARDGKAVFRFRIEDTVAARDDDARLIGLVVAAAQQLVHGFLRHGFRDAQQVQRQLRLAAHGVDVRKCVRRGDLPEEIRVVRDRREEVHGLHERQPVRDLIDGGVVALVKADKQPGIAVDLQAAQKLRQYARTDLCAAARARGELRKLNSLFCHGQNPHIRNIFFRITIAAAHRLAAPHSGKEFL